MSITFQLHTHQRHHHLPFAVLHGNHYCDFPKHKHAFSELFIVTEGSGEHTVADFQYSLSPGDVFVINGQVEHGFRKVKDLKLVNLMFEPHQPLFETPQLKMMPGYQALFNIEPIARQTSDYTAKLNLTRSQLDEVLVTVKKIEAEYHYAKEGFELMVVALMQQLVINLARVYQAPELAMNKGTTSLILGRALAYLEGHINSPSLRIEHIAEQAFVSTRQLERLFKRHLGLTPNQHIRKSRIEKAKQLLAQEFTIQQVADECGFSDSNYFSKCFKTELGVSPREYKKSRSMSG
ncbi:helix-turn-helix domain-containing protein [Vibrio sp. SCSIO 43136]|uniref:helix-turn-helix domain-containing protein n=1 Tax=Vibrio sp. SCSIO 43136 TaxID=2819101 RepID=UPI0020763082|nr:helix-turn-helix domain-containing protein [Vibrio sp. SCSIO 43136]USD67058.1 helix-turn-helix domain-containing protein [Vibrio sp. SCSIO 43136]